jgi:hypothetical protein
MRHDLGPCGILQLSQAANMVSVVMGDDNAGYIRGFVAQPPDLIQCVRRPASEPGINQGNTIIEQQKYVCA